MTLSHRCQRRALVVGSRGVVGGNLIETLLADGGWEISGVSRRPLRGFSRVNSLVVDLANRQAAQPKLTESDPTHVFFCAWTKCENELENIRINGAVVRNVLELLAGKKSVQHVALVTGSKHYLGSFEVFAQGPPVTPFREDQPRLSSPNFYYHQEDALFAAAQRMGFTYCVHRPYTIVGYAIGNAMNIGTTLACYASICRETGRPFTFPGSPVAWSGLSEYSDARLIAKHLLWAATTPSAHNLALNVVNGDQFRWSWLWPRLADYFGIAAAPYPGRATPLASVLEQAEPIWTQIVARYGLQPLALAQLASPWHTDLDLSRSFEIISDMSRSRNRGFSEYQDTERSFMDLFDRLRRERIIP
jgi:nucleoside-diphosphate-sugar epimerase